MRNEEWKKLSREEVEFFESLSVFEGFGIKAIRAAHQAPLPQS